jgi:hypothetical protein
MPVILTTDEERDGDYRQDQGHRMRLIAGI